MSTAEFLRTAARRPSKLASYLEYVVHAPVPAKLKILRLREVRRKYAGAGMGYQPIPVCGFRDIEFERPCHTRLLAILDWKSAPPSSVLDLGCNRGFFPLALRNIWRRTNFLGVDANPRLIEASNALVELMGYTRLRFECRKIGEEGSVPQQQFDVVLCLSLLHHIFAAMGRLGGCEVLKRVTDTVNHHLVFELPHDDERASWHGGYIKALPGGAESLIEILGNFGFRDFKAIGATRSHLADVTRDLWVAMK